MTIQKNVKTKHKLLDVIKCFKELPYYNTYIEKSRIKRLRNIDLFLELPFYEELSVAKTGKAFKGYSMARKTELTDKKDSLSLLEASKSSIKYLFNDLLDEAERFKYQINVKIFLQKYKV